MTSPIPDLIDWIEGVLTRHQPADLTPFCACHENVDNQFTHQAQEIADMLLDLAGGGLLMAAVNRMYRL